MPICTGENTARREGFKDFIVNGIDASVLLATGDALAERVVALKQERESSNG